MGVLTDFVVADRANARRVCESGCPSQDFAGLDAKGIDTVMLGTLHAVLTGGAFDPSFMSDALYSGGKNGPWVFEVPPNLVMRLAKLNAQQLRSTAAEWATTEEFSPEYEDWPVEAVQQMLADLAGLCKRAVGEDKAVLMWICL